MSHVLEESFRHVAAVVRRACEKVDRPVDSVKLLAVSKTVSADSIEAMYRMGHRMFAESRIQEAKPKIDLMSNSITWHFIGNIQKNKIRKIVKLFPVIHSVSSIEQIHQISRVAKEESRSPELFLQVNLAGEASKGGFAPEELRGRVMDLFSRPHAKCVGLMCIPPFSEDLDSSRQYFRELRELRNEFEALQSFRLPYLSMGMSHDFAVAIEEGATHVRVGSAIFGRREYQAPSRP